MAFHVTCCSLYNLLILGTFLWLIDSIYSDLIPHQSLPFDWFWSQGTCVPAQVIPDEIVFPIALQILEYDLGWCHSTAICQHNWAQTALIHQEILLRRHLTHSPVEILMRSLTVSPQNSAYSGNSMPHIFGIVANILVLIFACKNAPIKSSWCTRTFRWLAWARDILSALKDSAGDHLSSVMFLSCKSPCMPIHVFSLSSDPSLWIFTLKIYDRGTGFTRFHCIFDECVSIYQSLQLFPYWLEPFASPPLMGSSSMASNAQARYSSRFSGSKVPWCE